MNIFFEFRRTYTVDNSADNLRSKLQVLKDEWQDFATNITGRVKENGEFKLYPKWTLGYIQVLGFHQRLYYLKGKVTETGDRTQLKTVARPNYALVICFYAFPLLLAAKLLGINTFDMSIVELSYMALVFTVILGVIMIFGTIRLRLQFEKHMQLVN